MSVKQLIVGWNRGGLGYTYELLKRAGVDVGLTFGPDVTLETLRENLATARPYEVSPYVVPFLAHPTLKNVKVTFLLRDPMRVLNSLYFHGLFHSEKNSEVQRSAFKHLDGLRSNYQGRPAQASCFYLNGWLRLAGKHRPGLRCLRIEEGPRVLLEQLTGGCSDLPFLLPTVNASNCKQILVPSRLPKHSSRLMTALLTQLGYREWNWMPRGGHAHYVNADWHS
jgi:hypothetical protein